MRTMLAARIHFTIGHVGSNVRRFTTRIGGGRWWLYSEANHEGTIEVCGHDILEHQPRLTSVHKVKHVPDESKFWTADESAIGFKPIQLILVNDLLKQNIVEEVLGMKRWTHIVRQ